MSIGRMPGIVLVGFLAIQTAWAELVDPVAFDHQPWSQLLETYVTPIDKGRATVVDYQGFAEDRQQLRSYLKALSAVEQQEFDQWPAAQQLAFLINAYNAWTVELILSRWPDLDSIKELGSWFRSPWSKEFIPLLAETRSLDNIEHDLIRGSDRYQDPRIHFAVNCASIGCPALRVEAYTGARLNAQLEQQTQLFLSDRSRNYWQDETLMLSAIFKWYREDFEKGWLGYDSVSEFLTGYLEALALPPALASALTNNTLDIDYVKYDWRLNVKP